MISIIDKYRLLAVRAGDGGGGGGSSRDQEAADMAAAVAQGRGSTVTSARPAGSSSRSDTTTYGGGGGGRDSSDNAAAANAARIAAEKATYEQQQAQAAAAQKAAADNAARIAAERATYEQQQRAAQAASDNAARIAAEKASYEMPSAPSAPSGGTSLSDIVNQIIGIPSAEAKPVTTAQEFADAQRAIAAAKQMGVTGGVPIGYKSPADIAKEADLAEAQAQAAINAAAFRAGFPTGIKQPTMTTTFNPETSGIVPTGAFVPTEKEKTIPEKIAEFFNPTGEDLRYTSKYTLPDIGLRIGTAGTPAITTERLAQPAGTPFPTELARAAGTFTSPFEKVFKSVTEPTMTAQVSKQAEPKQSLFDEYNANPPVTANVPVPLPRPEDLGIETEPVTTTVRAPVTAVTPTTVAPTQKGVLDQLMSGLDAANAKRVAELEQAGKFAGGNKQQVAEALQVDPSALKSRIVFQDGQQKVDYYTKGLDQALGEAFTAPFQAVSNLFSPDVNKLPQGSYVRDPRFSDLFSQNVPSKGYGPYGDLTAEEYRQQYGGRDITPPVTPTSVPVTPAPVTPTPVPPAPPSAQSAWSRTRSGLPYDPYNYGYGGEYTYYSAKGGHVAPLSKVRK